MTADTGKLTIVVVGASGHLARTKILPALFALHCQDFLPTDFRIVGYARSSFDDAAFREVISKHLTCRYAPGASCEERMNEFLGRCHYVRGDYASTNGFLDLYQRLTEVQSRESANRMFYLAIPPSLFMDVARAIGNAGFVSCGAAAPWSRVVIEKPFGRDRASSDILTEELRKVFTEDQTYRIDHYLGKEVIQNLLVLRFANLIFEPLWSRQYVRDVQITWQENVGVEGRGGYFDEYGIIRDVVQNHLLQMLALTAMEPPKAFNAKSIRDEKVRVLKAIPPPLLEDVVIGQYAGTDRNGIVLPGYREDDTVPDDSLTPTFSAVVLRVENERWKDVPFMIRSGKGLDKKLNEIRVRFRELPENMFCNSQGCPQANELVIRVQPDEQIYFTIANKRPGLEMNLETRKLDLKYESAFSELIPDAYESLLLDVLRGEKSLFIRSDELAAAWNVFTPVLHEIEERRISPHAYEFGGYGPEAADELFAHACRNS